MRQTRMIEAIQESLRSHLWYLSKELVIFVLFDDHIYSSEHCAMANWMCLFPNHDYYEVGKPVFPIDLMVENTRMDSFVSPKSWVILNKLNANSTWLQKDVDEWDADEKYERIKECLHYLKVVNDLAEPCIKNTQEYADLAKYS